MHRALAWALAAALLLAAAPSPAQPQVRVALLPVVVHSLGESDYLQRGIADMLGTRLEQNSAVTVVRVQDPAKATLDPNAARSAAQAAGASFAVFGSFTQFGEGASLDLRCVSAQGGGGDDARSIFVQSGSIGEIIPRLDEVADRVARYVLSPGAPPEVAAGPGAVTERGLGAPARQGDVDALRSRVERLESVLYGRQGAGAAPPQRPPAPPPSVVRPGAP
jgi:outer membrane protein insertion porin family